VIESSPLSKIVGAHVFLKLDNAQPTGSFKIRGIGHLCQRAVANGATHLISSSGGNAGLAVAYAGRKLGVKVTVVVPQSTSAFMRRKITLEEAAVVVHGAAWDDAHQEALRLAKELKSEVVHPFDHPLIWEGHSSIIDEIKEQLPSPPTHLITVCGGGGLLIGLLQGLRRVGWTSVRVHVVETTGADSLAQALEAGHLVTLREISSLATTLGAKTVAPQALKEAQAWPVASHVVSDNEALAAVVAFQADHQALVELSCGAGLALLYSQVARAALGPLQPTDRLLVVVCGGNAVSIETIEQWQRTLAQRAQSLPQISPNQ